MGTDKVLDNPGVNYCAFTLSPVFPTCPVTNEPFVVAVTVQYHPAGYIIEYVEFEKYLRRRVERTPAIHPEEFPEECNRLTLEDLAVDALRRAGLLLGPDVPVCIIVETIASYHCKAKAVAHTKNWEDV